MQVKIVLPLRFDDPAKRGETVKIVELPDVPFSYAVTVYAGGTTFSPRLTALVWDEVEGFTIRLDPPSPRSGVMLTGTSR